jgi:hypothetical protein
LYLFEAGKDGQEGVPNSSLPGDIWSLDEQRRMGGRRKMKSVVQQLGG